MTKFILAHELLEQGISKTRIAQRLNVSRRTVIRWAQAIERHDSLELMFQAPFIGYTRVGFLWIDACS